ncbi:MAG: phage head-tail connector protein [Alphaproteobacteria bacterium]|nr:phage head-tail connector protein [Alphaproteobacteria bacterium]
MINFIIKNCDEQVINVNMLKNHFRIAHDHEDEYLNEIIKTATNILEDNLNLSILHKTYNCIVDNYNANYFITLPITNITSINSVTDSKNNAISFSTNNKYEITLNSTGAHFPISIKYNAGFTNNIEEIPNDLKLSTLQISKNIYDNSEEYLLDSNFIQCVINKYKKLHI